MIYLTEWVHQTVGLSPQLQARLLQSLLVFLFLWVLHRLVMRVQTRRNDDPSVLYRWRKTSSYIASGLGVLLVGGIWFEGIQSLSTFLGLLSAGVAILGRYPGLVRPVRRYRFRLSDEPVLQ